MYLVLVKIIEIQSKKILKFISSLNHTSNENGTLDIPMLFSTETWLANKL